eukprot:365982-Chlamydomonas_euryale.AAC.3
MVPRLTVTATTSSAAKRIQITEPTNAKSVQPPSSGPRSVPHAGYSASSRPLAATQLRAAAWGAWRGRQQAWEAVRGVQGRGKGRQEGQRGGGRGCFMERYRAAWATGALRKKNVERRQGRQGH